MSGDAPRAWLRPAAAAFGLVARARAAAYARGLRRPERLQGPVVSVGNLSVGGSGKTPVVQRLCALLQDAGRPVAVLSRGYRGAYVEDALLVSDGASVLVSASRAGDEPVMLARALPGVVVAVGRRRADAGRLVEARFGPRVHVLDDGYQHLALARDLDVLCLVEADLGDALLPAGRLREPVAAAGRAGIVLFNGSEASLRSLRDRLGERVLAWRRRGLGFAALDGSASPAPGRAFLLSGIARPERFAADVAASCAVVGQAAFPDHHPFGARDVETVAARARGVGADAVVTTAKDAVRLPPMDLPVLVYRIAADIDGEDRLRERLLRATAGAA